MSAIVYSADPNPQPDESEAAVAVRTARGYLNDYVADKPHTVPEHPHQQPHAKFTYAEAVGLQVLQRQYRELSSLSLAVNNCD